MPIIKIAIINSSLLLSDDEVRAVMAGLQAQISEDFAPVWGIDAQLKFYSRNQNPLPGEWWLVLLDDSDQAGALGYHDLSNEGLPMGKVFAATDRKYGLSWTVTASHELLEMLIDPAVNLSVLVESSAYSGTLYAYEVCDACEAERFAYLKNGILVSDFVFPSWFESFWKEGQTQFDFQNQIRKPFALLPGGYIGVYKIAVGTGWYQKIAKRSNVMRAVHRSDSRIEQRGINRDKLVKSDVLNPFLESDAS